MSGPVRCNNSVVLIARYNEVARKIGLTIATKSCDGDMIGDCWLIEDHVLCSLTNLNYANQELRIKEMTWIEINLFYKLPLRKQA